VWSVASAHVERRLALIVHGKPLMDDGLYCVVKVVFAPTMPDPKGSYSIKFVRRRLAKLHQGRPRAVWPARQTWLRFREHHHHDV
jgi:hypothetical protein